MRADPAMTGSGEERLPHDAYFTRDPQCVARLARCFNLRGLHVLEPCAGLGHMALDLESHGAEVKAWELHTYPGQIPTIWTGVDFLALKVIPPDIEAIITNPPFNQPVPYIENALDVLPHGHICMLLRHEWMCGKGTRDGRQELLALSRFMAYLPILGRPYWHEEVTASPRHNYGWYIWGPGAYPRAELWL